MMIDSTLQLKIEALLFASPEPLSAKDLSQALAAPQESAEPIALDTEEVDGYIMAIREKYATEHFPFELTESGGGYQFLTRKAFHPVILSLNGDKYQKRLSATALETLSIIAYRQPVPKSEIDHIRGVSSDYSIQKLLEKELIYISGRQEDAIGKPLLYCTTRHFLDYLGINGPEGLPKLKEIVSIEAQEPNDSRDALPEIRAGMTIES